MAFAVASLECLLLTFSYGIVSTLTRVLSKPAARYSLYMWGAIIVLLALVTPDPVTFQLPRHFAAVRGYFVPVLIGALVVSRYSGYRATSRSAQANFALTYPIVEEIVFRGLVLGVIRAVLPESSLAQFGVPIPDAVLISAFLFAIAHIQYYGLSKTAVNFMGFAFIGGLCFGTLTWATHSILLGLIIHVGFNTSAMYYKHRPRNGRRSNPHGLPTGGV